MSQEGGQKRRSRESSGEPESQVQKWQHLKREPIIIESDNELDEPRVERFMKKAVREWMIRLLGVMSLVFLYYS